MALLGDKAVGDIVKINVNGEVRDFIIVHQGLPSSMYASSCDGTWLLMKDIYDMGEWWTDKNDYENSDIHAYLNSTFYNLFDDNIKAAIKHVAIPYVKGTGYGDLANDLYTYIFLLSAYEVGWTETGSEEFWNDGAKLSYFLKGTDVSANNKRIANYNGSATTWWLRSPRYSDVYDVWCVNTTGSHTATYMRYGGALGVRPAFILPFDTIVGNDGTVGNSTTTITSDTASGSDLGEISVPFNIVYTVNDVDDDTVTITEYLDDVPTRTYTAVLDAENTFEAVSDPVLFQKILNGQHTLKIVANDTKENSEPYTVTFNKQLRTAVITLNEPLPADDVIKVAVVTVTGIIPKDATIEVLVTNNALDENPVWEDMSLDIQHGLNHVFTNRTAQNGFAFNLKVTATRGASGEQGFISSIGGAFE